MSEWIVAARTSEITADRATIVAAGGRKIALYATEGAYFASEAYCPHERECLDSAYVENGTVECSLHYAVFDIRTGQRVSGPATRPLRVFPVKCEGGEILVDIAGSSPDDNSGCITTSVN